MAIDYPFNITSSIRLLDESDESNSQLESATAGHPGVPVIVAGVLIPHIICSMVIGLRAWCRLFLMKKWYTDDTLIIVGWGSATVVCIIYSVAAVAPRIRNAVTSTNNQTVLYMEAYLMRQYLGLIFYQICLCLTKLSIAACYVRMFVDRPRERNLAWGTILWVIVYGLPLLFASIFQCHPGPGLFFGVPLQCFSLNSLLIMSASLHAITDIWLVVMIIPCVRSLALPRRQKIALSAVLSGSVFVVLAGMIRLQLILIRQFKPTSYRMANTLAFFVLTIVECDIALICATAPTLRLLFVKYCPRLVGENGLVHRPRRWTRRGAAVNPFPSIYNGYWSEEPRPSWIVSPITQTRTSQRSFQDVVTPTAPAPSLVASHRTSTPLSLRTRLADVVAKGKTMAAGEAGDQKIPATTQLGQWDLRSPAGFEGHRGSYYEQYLDYHAHMYPTPRASRRTSRSSHLMGENDSASLSRLSRVTCVCEGLFGVMHSITVADTVSGGDKEREREEELV